MKNLTQFLKESVVVEAKVKYFMATDYYNPSTLYIIENPSQNTLDQLRNADWVSEELENSSAVELIAWKEGSFMQYGGANNLSAFKKDVLSSIEDSLKEYGYEDEDEVEEVNAGYMYINPMVPLKVFKKNPWQYFETVIKNSWVNGDSNYCRAIVDLKKKTVLMCGKNEIVFLTDKEARKVIFGL